MRLCCKTRSAAIRISLSHFDPVLIHELYRHRIGLKCHCMKSFDSLDIDLEYTSAEKYSRTLHCIQSFGWTQEQPSRFCVEVTHLITRTETAASHFFSCFGFRNVKVRYGQNGSDHLNNPRYKLDLLRTFIPLRQCYWKIPVNDWPSWLFYCCVWILCLLITINYINITYGNGTTFPWLLLELAQTAIIVKSGHICLLPVYLFQIRHANHNPAPMTISGDLGAGGTGEIGLWISSQCGRHAIQHIRNPGESIRTGLMDWIRAVFQFLHPGRW